METTVIELPNFPGMFCRPIFPVRAFCKTPEKMRKENPNVWLLRWSLCDKSGAYTYADTDEEKLMDLDSQILDDVDAEVSAFREAKKKKSIETPKSVSTDGEAQS